MLFSLHPNIIVHVENVVSLFSSPSTSSQKVRKCGGHNFLSQAIYLELEQNQFDHYTHPCVPTVYACEFLVAFIWCLCKRKYPGIIYTFMYGIGMYQVEVLLSQFEWNSRTHPLRHGSRTAIIRDSRQFPARRDRYGTARQDGQ